jgi:RNA polymerase sigma factor (sigma-70 family)
MSQMNSNDGELLKLLGAGSDAALAELFDRYAPAVSRYAWTLAGSRSDAAELVQDTFVTVWKNSRRIQINDSVLPWLLVTCRNLARNLARKHAREHSTQLSDSDLGAGDGFNGSDAREQLRWVTDEIARLEPIDQQICELCLIEGRPYKEVAELLGTSVGAVKQRVSRARTRLRKVVFDHEN